MTDKRKDHMQRRKEQGLSYRELADEFNTSKSTAHRKLKDADEDKDAD